MKKCGKIIAVDFDGTLCESRYPWIGAPKKAVIEYILNQKRRGAKIILWTCRVGTRLDEAVDWCRKQGIEFDAVNENIQYMVDLYGSDCRKIFANEYIDDKAVPLDFITGSRLNRRLRKSESSG